MKLNHICAAQAAEQLEATTLPEANPAVNSLSELFGEHTFFIDADGLFIVEAESDGEIELGRVVKLARWADRDRTVLSPHQRETTSLVVTLNDAA